MEENMNTENTQENVNEALPDKAEDTNNTLEAENGAGDAPESQEEEGKEEKKGSFFNDVLEIMESVIISIFIVLLGFTFVARPVTVEGDSMNPTLINQDKLIMRTLFYTPTQGDIVIIDNHVSYTYSPGTQTIVEGESLNKRLIKRVIATGGQSVDIDFGTGTVTVDGETLREDYIADLTHYDPGTFSYPITVPEGYVFVMGDNRNRSTDSRDGHVGFVKEEDVLGTAILRFYPLEKFGLVD